MPRKPVKASLNVVEFKRTPNQLADYVDFVLKEVVEAHTNGEVRNLLIAWDTDENTCLRVIPENLLTLGHLMNCLRLEYEAVLWEATHDDGDDDA